MGNIDSLRSTLYTGYSLIFADGPPSAAAFDAYEMRMLIAHCGGSVMTRQLRAYTRPGLTLTATT